MQTSVNKIFLELAGRPIIMHSLDVFAGLEAIAEIVIVAHPEELELMKTKINDNFRCRKPIKVVSGGAERQHSVQAGLEALDDRLSYVAVHDAARPLVSASLVQRVIQAARDFSAACPGVLSKDTLKEVDEKGNVCHTLDRSRIYQIQTPQVFRLNMLKDAYVQASIEGFLGTDDAVLFEKYCGPVQVVHGEEQNLKITTREDMVTARGWLGDEKNMRVGIGYDVHPLVEGRALILGGVNIPFEKGLLGHSDADVLIHAICDALLGAAGGGDIGHHFPDKDPQYKDISSLVLLEKVDMLITQQAFEIMNIDCTIIAEKPYLAPFIADMKRGVADSLGLDIRRINIKATTNERLGSIGRGEGIAVQAIALLR
ncbi:MAG: 2-C-methyl-D-erythritol 2,4-cyclodiphosphate synthase [Syntrophomonadaceae bacterium]|nr:2-C-methyl-D-erythritol 2,4-cyclodiphosphate synthase [Syntrophomonadaceae bacterium]